MKSKIILMFMAAGTMLNAPAVIAASDAVIFTPEVTSVQEPFTTNLVMDDATTLAGLFTDKTKYTCSKAGYICESWAGASAYMPWAHASVDISKTGKIATVAMWNMDEFIGSEVLELQMGEPGIYKGTACTGTVTLLVNSGGWSYNRPWKAGNGCNNLGLKINGKWTGRK